MSPASETTRTALVAGLLRQRPGETFSGRIEMEVHAECVYYAWRLESASGEFLGSVSRPVSLRLVPAGQGPFEFALAHAVAGIQHYRVGRARPFEVTAWEWDNA